ncbi:MAG TPA: hypothetical protein VGG57_14280 [Stellaceae bacterium]|jgi:hypothetical protein
MALDLPLIGVNEPNMAWLSESDRVAMFANMAKAGVKAVRLNLQPPLEQSRQAIIEAHRAGLEVVLVTTFSAPQFYEAGTTERPRIGRIPAAHRLSEISVTNFANFFGEFWRSLAKSGVTLAAIEVGNEINWAEFNGDLGVYNDKGGGVGLEQLANWGAISDGLQRYIGILKAVATLKRSIPGASDTLIVGPGLATISPRWAADLRADALDARALHVWLLAHGAGQYVDALAIHHYPDPTASLEARRSALQEAIAACLPDRVRLGCMVTEWGVRNDGRECPLDDATRAGIVREERAILDQAVTTKQLSGFMYFEWSGTSATSIWRCGELSAAGRAAIAPLAH